MRLPRPAGNTLGNSAVGSRDLQGNLAVIALAITLIVVLAVEPDNDLPPGVVPRPLDALAAALFVAASAALLLRRRWPLLVFAFALACNAGWHKLAYDSSLINLPTFLAAYAVGLTGDRRRQLAALAIGCCPIVVVFLIEDLPLSGAFDAVGWTIVAVLFGEVVRSRGILLEAYRERAERAEADRESEAQRRVATERLRIARDLHDLLAHTVSLMMVQAGVAADALPSRPEAAQRAITALRQSGRQATAEIKATVEVLRQDEAAELAPSPTTADLTTLVETVREVGIRVRAEIDPETATLAPLLQLTIYRVVQEALTNVTRHATATEVNLAIVRLANDVTITVRDNGRGANGSNEPGHGGGRSEGHGLAGIRERAALAGGSVSYGNSPAGGFVLTARIPADRAVVP